MTQKTALLWFRQDLRLRDNPALTQAIADGYHIIPIYILDNENAAEWSIGAASRWWLHHSLDALNASLSQAMIFRTGKADDILPTLIEQTGASALYWNRCYEPWRIARDKAIKSTLQDKNIEISTHNASLLWEPWEVLKSDRTPYKVFTPYYRKGCLNTRTPDHPLSAPDDIPLAKHDVQTGSSDDLDLLPKIRWDNPMEQHWTISEDGAHQRLQLFLEQGLRGYKEDRNRPDMDNTSRLSPYLHHGQLSPRQVWHAGQIAGIADGLDSDTDIFCSELGWREFSYYLLYHFPQITWDNLQSKFDAFPWEENSTDMTIPADQNGKYCEHNILRAWQSGQTGIPIVDAGMRQLWQTGWMHNRVRMIVGSLLVKNLLIHWHQGEQWFWNCLVDADLASNAASWQWIAGSGADAAPYFRIFNPVTQGQKFDPNGEYVRSYVPELKHMDNKYIHCPWDSPVPPAAYPAPIIDLKSSRQRALKAFETTKKTT